MYENKKWDIDLEIVIDKETWITSFKICFNTIQDNFIAWTQYTILTHILGCKYYLHKIKVTPDSICRLCQNESETLIHLFHNCSKITVLWNDINTWISNKLKFKVNFNKITVILGYQNKDCNSIPINFIIMTTKSYIFWCARECKTPNIIQLQSRLQSSFIEQRCISIKNFKSEEFDKKWNKWRKLLCEDFPEDLY